MPNVNTKNSSSGFKYIDWTNSLSGSYTLPSYFGHTISSNNQSNIKKSKGPVIACGNHSIISTSNAITKPINFFTGVVSTNPYLYIRGRAFVPRSYSRLNYAVCTTTLSSLNPHMAIFTSPESVNPSDFPLLIGQPGTSLSDLIESSFAGGPAVTIGSDVTYSDLSDTDNTRFTGSVEVQTGPDGLLYWWIVCDEIQIKLGSYCLWMD